ncbi:MAG TPA: restriction endonuclease [Candidatus Limnocylindrales bacterium]|nr:restriction endonuclease [Candidatus Limnocylindrales bacterium]
MPRRRSDGLAGDLFDAFRTVPFPVAVGGAIAIFLLMYFAVPAMATGTWAPMAAAFGHVFAFFFALVAIAGGLVGLIERRGWRRLLDRQTGTASIQAESWQDFEALVAEAYRRQGYQVTMRGGPVPDGGVDLELRGHDGRLIVQCKHWKARSVGVEQIRALYGVLVHEHADGAILMTSGSYTDEARTFAAGKPVQLVDGDALEDLIRRVRKPAADVTPEQPVAGPPAVPGCPKCGKPMVTRTARSGRFAGQLFWGCSDFPTCNGTRKAA